ncbi:MAG: HAMP domain-containing protein, partial [Candidatus Methylumidiphilus sp.]
MRKAKDRDDFKMADFESYRPNLGKPAAFVASPIFDGNKMIGILIFQFPIDEVTKIMSGDFKWKEQGFRNTGEVYAVGSDFTMRSRSRFMVENPTDFLKTLRENGIAESIVKQIERQGNVLLTLPVRNESVEKALQGKQGVGEIRDYRNEPVISAYGPVQLDSVRWAIIAEMDVAEAYEPVIAFSRMVLAAGTGIALLTTLLAVILARILVRPLKSLTEGARRISAGEENVQVDVNTHDEFQELGDAFNEMSSSLTKKT